MENNFQTNISNIRKAIDNNKLVVFAGAGISVDAGVPKWSELIKVMKKEINVSENETDYLKIAQLYYNERQQKEYIDKIRSVLNHKKVQSNEIHEEIFKLNPNGILTTNYDDLLDQVIEKEALPYSIVTRDKDFPYAINNNLLVKVHGDLNNTDIVLKEDDYLNYSTTHPLIESFIKSVFSNKLVMFVGYSYSDYNLKHIIKNVKTILGNNYQYSYLLTTDKNISEAQKNYFKLNGIILVNYSEFEKEILSFLNGNNYYNEKLYLKGKNLKKQGQELLNLLVYINHYNPFLESLKGLNLIEQAFLSLERYSEIKSLSPDFLVNLYPFNVNSKKQYNYHRFSMSISNQRLFERFKKYVVKDQKNKYKLFLPKRFKINSTNKNELEIKLNEVIYRLNLSNIFYLSNYKNVNELKEASSYHEKICNCLTCKYSRFEFDEILDEISISKFDSNITLEEAISVAYMHFKFGYFDKAFELFKELGNKAWTQGKYFQFLIIKTNLLRLNRFIYSDLTKNEKEKANLNKYLNYNIDDIYNRIPYLGKDENTLLAQIKEDYVFDNSRSNILKILDVIYSIKDLYDNKGQKWGDTNSVGEATFYLQNMIGFYTNNNIIYDEFSEFKNTINNGLEIYLISSILDKNYNNKLDYFNNVFSNWFIYYGNYSKIINIISRYKIEFLKYEKIEDTGLLLAKRFFENFYYKTKYETENSKIKKRLEVEFFRERCLRYTKNIFILLAYTELSIFKYNFSDFKTSFIKFLKYESFLDGKSIEYLSKFILSNKDIFNQTDIIEILKSIELKASKYSNFHFYSKIASICLINNYFISDAKFLKSIYERVKHFDPESNIEIYIYTLSTSNNRQEYSKIIHSKLEKTDSVDYYLKCKYYKIEIENNIEMHIINKFLNTFNSTPLNQNFFNFLYYNYRDKLYDLLVINKLDTLIQFFLNPEIFDYKHFNVDWINHLIENNGFIENDLIIEKFKSANIFKQKLLDYIIKNNNKSLYEFYFKIF